MNNDRQRILVVDDERINRSVLADLLSDDYQVLLAKSGAQALERVAQDNCIDLILLDVMMSDMDGYAVIRRLKDDARTMAIPVVFITALDSEGDEERGLNLGASDYIRKPFNPAIVRARVGNLLSFVRQRKLLETLAGRDGLTEIANRRRFDEALAREFRRKEREASCLSVAMIDVDYFKQYNDRYGHARGDWALKAIARALSFALNRPADLVARYGGEEFALILPDTDAKGGRAVAESVRTAVELLHIPHELSPVAPYVTISLGGCSVVQTPPSAAQLMEIADARLYAAKQQGRNRVVWDAPP